jgi:hypothetical protein
MEKYLLAITLRHKKRGLIKIMTKHILIPDTQIKPGVCVSHLNALGHYLVDQRPDVIVQIGDWADMHSLSTYDMGKKAGEGARYEDDIVASTKAMEVLMEPLKQLQKKQRKNKEKIYRPELILTLGNHENRINRHVNAYPILHGKLSTEDLRFEKYGWKVFDFLDVVERDGIAYSHYFPRNANGQIVQTTRGAPNARVQVQREQQSCSSGHLQGLSYHVQQLRNRRCQGLIAGSFYMHEEDYLGPQGTAYWRGVVVKHEVENGQYDPMFVSMDYLLRRWWDGKERWV